MTRQIKIDEYTCPSCNGDLMVQAVDFTSDSLSVHRTKTSYQCIGCRGEFYCIEEAAVTTTTNPYKCIFCGEKSIYLSLKGDWADYWKCAPCQASFSESYTPGWKGVQTINMYTTIRGRLYVLRQFLHLNKSRIDMLPADVEDTVMIVSDFDFLFPNVTPANINEKLQTYILFS